MKSPKKITVDQLRALITEAISEDSSIEDASDMAAEQEESEDSAKAASEEQAANESAKVDDKVILERWRKLAGILNG